MQGLPIWDKIFVAALSIFAALTTTAIVAYFRRARDKVELKVRLVIDQSPQAPALVATVVCKGIRSAKIKGVAIAATFHKIEVQPADGGPKARLRNPTVSFSLVSLAKPTNEHGFVLERDDICKFYFPATNEAVHPLSRLPSENLRLYATLFDESTIQLASGLPLLQCMRSLANAIPEQPTPEAPTISGTVTGEIE